VVLLTGASAGIGKETAIQLSRLGARLCLCARREPLLQEIVKTCEGNGAQAFYVVADMTVEADCRKVVEACVKRFERIDVLLLNAGRGSLLPFEEVRDLRAYREVMDVNYWGCVAMTMFALPHIKRSSGNITVISSLAGKFAFPRRTGYAPTKHALQAFFNVLRLEQPSISITLVCPGYVVSDIHQNAVGARADQAARRDLSKFMPTDVCVRATLEASARRDRELLLGPRTTIAVWLTAFAPSLFDRMAIKASREGLNDE